MKKASSHFSATLNQNIELQPFTSSRSDHGVGKLDLFSPVALNGKELLIDSNNKANLNLAPEKADNLNARDNQELQNLGEGVSKVQVEINDNVNVAEKYSSVSEVKRFLFKDNNFKELDTQKLHIFLEKFKDHINLAKKNENFIIYFKVPIPQHAADDCHDEHHYDDGYTIYNNEEKPAQIVLIIKCLSDNDIDIKWIKTNCDITIKLAHRVI
jgi:hypothetical protein